MEFVSKKQFRALALLIITVLFLEFFFGGTSLQLKTAFDSANGRQQQVAAAAASECAPPSNIGFAPLVPNHRLCNGRNPPYGNNGVVCNVFGLAEAGLQPTDVKAICATAPSGSGGCCQLAGFTNATAAAKAIVYSPAESSFLSSLIPSSASLGSFAKGIGQGLVIGTAMSVIGQGIGALTGGGSGSGGSYTGSSGVEFRNAAEEQSYLQFSENLQEETGLGEFNLAFGTGGTEEAPKTSLAYGTNDQVTTESTNESGKPKQAGDSVTTSYESLKSVSVRGSSGGVAAIPGEGEFDQDFYGGSLDSSGLEYNSGLSLADLELGAEEARRREALLNEQRGVQQAGGIEDYRSSNVARSNSRVEVNPLSNTRYDDLEYTSDENTKPSWWQNLVLLVGKLLGLSS